MDNIKLPKNIADLKAYSSAKSEKISGSTWLNANESPYTKSWEFTCDTLNRYPEPQPEEVIERYANYSDVLKEQILMTRGADEGIELLIRTFCEPSVDNISLFVPTYGMYKVTADTHNVGLNTLSQSMLIEGSVDEICNACQNSKLVFICNPNNPTGALISPQKIEQIAQSLSGQSIVVVDEAYIEFSEADTSAALISGCQNVVVLRTLSKAFSLAGLRVGFLLTNQNLIKTLRKVLAPYPVATVVAQLAFEALSVGSITQMRRQVTILNRAKSNLVDWLCSSSIVENVLSGKGNFVTLQLKNTDYIQQALDMGLVMRPFTLFEQSNWLRISIGSEQELEQVKQWLEQCEVSEDVK